MIKKMWKTSLKLNFYCIRIKLLDVPLKNFLHFARQTHAQCW